MRAIVRGLIFIVLLTCVRPQDVFAQTQDVAPDTVQTREVAPDTVPLPGSEEGTAELPLPRSEHAPGRSSYWIPTLELPAFLGLLNGAGRILYPNEMRDGKRVFSSTWETTRDHLQEQGWVPDENPFNINQFGHPYQGAIMYNLPRSTGLGFWPSLIYSNVGSFMWEMAGETTPPSTNDIITTGQAGSMLGEALYRIAATVRPERPGHTSRPWRGLLADLIDPPRGLNRHVFGDHYRTGLSETPPALSWQLGVGTTKDALAHDYNNPGRLLQRDATIEYSMTYGIPGKPGYDFRQPFSYFDLHVSVLSNRRNAIESITLRGLLLSTKSSSHGVWGVYGIYDYISPYLFRVSNTALSFGTTRAHWIGRAVAFQTSILAGVGFGAAGTTAGIASTPTSEALRDYHFGVTPQALGAVRLIVFDRMMLDGTARGYYVSGLGSDDTHGSEALFRGNAGIILRLIGGHSIGVRFSASTRNAKYGTLPDRNFSEQTWTVAYSFVGSGRLSGGKWQ